MNQQPPLLPGPHKPGKVQAIAIMTLINGILNILLGIGVAGGLSWTIVCWPISAYPVVLGILEIIYASKLFSNAPGPLQPARYLAIMEIVNILFTSVPSLVVGILALVFYDDPEVKAFFANLPAKVEIYS
ncbi:MAG TPA: hypothetical protein VMC09_13585 [Anaerolineales bacterium]|nr:hypothetical protein [Anaerolineales bacterium]